MLSRVAIKLGRSPFDSYILDMTDLQIRFLYDVLNPTPAGIDVYEDPQFEEELRKAL